MVFLPLRAAAVLAAVAALSACSSLSGMRLPSMPSMPSWATWGGASKAQAVAPVVAAAPALKPTERTELWRGIYRQDAEIGRFTECRTGAEMPVAQTGDSALLQAAYLASRSAPGAPLWVEVQGRWVQRARADMPPSANAKELVLLVERFVSVSSQTSCVGW
ncbi:hypothetical protein N0K08_00035 [Acidovorax sp. Be4]|uniref:NlpE C-terminal OB domain-containing protein n=1 Tax=Acidovorax bellezanensis TaxID=2976702 RepID=A0ABT2PFV5_9BURK|nr:hypothetical protein [Acidovorax sp. Be4]MCT9809015.1 hypothetical protein [Acidovorax sp. Be4]